MKRHLLSVMLLIVATISASAASFAKAPKSAPAKAPMHAAANMTMINMVEGLYDETVAIPNYYVVLSTNKDARYDKNSGNVKIDNGYLLCLDLFSHSSNPIALPTGVYMPGGQENGVGAFTFNPEYSYLLYYENGKEVASATCTVPVTVKCDDNGIYTLTTEIISGENTIEVNYTGRIPLENVNAKPSAYTHFKHDIDITMRGGVAFYQGITDYSRNGVTCINLYSRSYDENTGAMTANGYNLSMMVAHKRYVRKEDFAIVPGTYEVAFNMARYTWYPCREIEYTYNNQAFSFPFGSYIRQLDESTAERYTYGYLASGTFVIEEVGDGVYKGTLDAKTNLGYSVKVKFEGKISLNTDNAEFPTTLSTLTDDVDLDFSKIETGRIWHRGMMGGCRNLTVDLGSPAGRDEGINYGGDLMRMEFLCPERDALLKPGVYTVVERRWNEYELRAGGTYDPMSLNKFHFDTKGGLDGTVYQHFKNGSYCVVDDFGPAEEGTVRVSTDDFKNYRFDINIIDDAGFEIRGSYDGPIEYMYDHQALATATDYIELDTNIRVALDGGRLTVLNAGNAPFTLFDLNGRAVLKAIATDSPSVAHLAKGIYILKINDTTCKIAL